jgi:hypothetical protein
MRMFPSTSRPRRSTRSWSNLPFASGCREEPLLGIAPYSAPRDAQLFEQLRAEHDIAVLAALPSRI